MPVTIRSVSPVDVSLNRIDAKVQRDELLCVANGTLANLIRQLSSLSRNAEQLFSETHREILKIDHTANTLFLRLNRLSQKMQQPGSARADLTSLEDNHMRKAFRSTNIIDQHSLDRQTLPAKLSELYTHCEPPPDLNQLNAYRDDKTRDSLSLYTDPGYFFDLWKQEMLKDIGRVSRSAATNAPGGAYLSKSPTRNRRQREHQQQPIYSAPTIVSYQRGQPQPHFQQPPIYQSNVLLQYNRNADETRSGGSNNHHQPTASNKFTQSQQNEQSLQFPSEYEAPHNLLKISSQKSQVLRDGNENEGRNADAFFTNHHSNQQSIQNRGDSQQMEYYPSNYEGSATPQDRSIAQNSSGDQPQLLVTGGQNRGVLPNFRGFLDNDEDDELPPPPPALSSHMATMIAENHDENGIRSTADSTADNQMLGNPAGKDQNFLNDSTPNSIQMVPVNAVSKEKSNAVVTGQIQNIPPPPPPPPPPSSMLANVKSGSFAQDTDVTVAKSQESSGGCISATTVSNLMLDIQRGKQLKKVQMETEMAQKRSSEGNDVAAILRRRMEHVLGNDDDDEDNISNDDAEWDD